MAALGVLQGCGCPSGGSVGMEAPAEATVREAESRVTLGTPGTCGDTRGASFVTVR